MDYVFEKSWNETVTRISASFGEKLDYAGILFLIGFQELGQTDRDFKKDEKISLMHIAICTLLEPYGYYTFSGKDADGWPHWERVEEIPPSAPEQELLIRKAIVNYFK